jgi:hypothetical protein
VQVHASSTPYVRCRTFLQPENVLQGVIKSGSIMSQPPIAAVECPRCPKCEEPMLLIRSLENGSRSEVADVRMRQVRPRQNHRDVSNVFNGPEEPPGVTPLPFIIHMFSPGDTNRQGFVFESNSCGYRPGDMAPRRAWRVRSGAALFLQFLYPVLLIIDNRCRMRIGARHADVRQRHDQCLAFSFGDDVAHDPALVSRIRQI